MADRRTVTAAARVSPAELADWRAKAAAAGVSLSALLRQAMARTRTWTAPATEVERERTRELARLGASERRACRVLGQPRTTQRRGRKVVSDEGALRGDIVRLASRFGRYGYRRVTDMLRIEGWGVKHKRVERIWRQEGLKVPERQPKRGRLWLNDGSCIRLRPLYRGHVWSYDFVASRTHDGRALKLLTVLDEQWRREYNTVRPHSACGGFPPAPEAIKPSPWFLRMPVLHGPPQVLGLT